MEPEDLRQVDVTALAASSPAERLAALGSGSAGLTELEVARRRAVLGPNEPVAEPRRHQLRLFASNFIHTLALLLWFAAGLAFASGTPELGGAIVAIIAVNGLFAFLQESRAERIVAGLMQRVSVKATVVRGAVERAVPTAELVPGDVVRLAAGDVVPADCVLLAADNVSLDLSILTGESRRVPRTAEPVRVGPRARWYELACFAPAGAAVVTGKAEAVVYATGPASSIGRIAMLTEEVHRGRSLLERQVGQLSRITAVLAVLSGAATLLLASAVTEVGFLSALTFATGVIVALVPEGLLPTLSVSLAIGARRMAGRGAAVRRLAAVDVVGSVTIICTDKTGTLTQNTLSVLELVDAAPGAREEALLAAALCNEAHLREGRFEGDPIDVALAQWVAAEGGDVEELRARHPRVADVPFDARRRFMSVTSRFAGQEREHIKGAPEAVLSRLGIREEPAWLAAAVSTAAARGERLLLLGVAAPGETPRLLGLFRLHDPPRPETPASIAACRRASVRVVMLTGDHPLTARAVARDIGLSGDETLIVEGEAIDLLTDEELVEMCRQNAVFARTDPAQKLRIVSVLRAAGEVVLVTGDGINDAPALRAADVGVAMGLRGTEVAKQAADIVLTDDNFATIVAAIEEGRSIRANIRRFASYVFTSNVAELAPFLVHLFTQLPFPLAVVQVLAIDLGTDIVPALALGAEPPSPGTMGAPPEPPSRPLLTARLAARTFLFLGLLEAALGLAAFFGFHLARGWLPGTPLISSSALDAQARTLTFLGIVGGQVGCLLAQRTGSLRERLDLRGNRWLGWGIATELGLALALVYVPGLNRAFSMAPVGFQWLLVLPAAALLFLLVDLGFRPRTPSVGTR